MRPPRCPFIYLILWFSIFFLRYCSLFQIFKASYKHDNLWRYLYIAIAQKLKRPKNGQILLENPICIMLYRRNAPGLANKILHPVKASRLPHTPPQWFDCNARAFEQFFPFWGYKNLSLSWVYYWSSAYWQDFPSFDKIGRETRE